MPKAAKAARAATTKPKGAKKRRGVALKPTELLAADAPIAEPTGRTAELAATVRADGGSVIGAYREPLGGRELLFVALPLERVAPTPYQRDVSDSHVRKLTRAMDKTKRFLDPVIVVHQDGKYLTPNGNHRLTALRELGSKTIIGLLVPETEVAYQILALNIEKAHNLRERSLEVVRMVRDLGGVAPNRKETELELELEEPSLVTLGFAYEQRGRLAGGAYHAVLRKVDQWVDKSFTHAIPERERRAAKLLKLDDAVNEAVARLKEKGLTSPYLKTFVVARVNPLRFIKGEPPSFDELLDTMTKRASGMKADKINAGDLARSGGAPDDSE
jgi:ParB family chromosome partitioning protein